MDVDDLLTMRERAWRVLQNNNASGSARRLAEDLLYLTDHVLASKRKYRRRVARQAMLARQEEVMEQLKREMGG